MVIYGNECWGGHREGAVPENAEIGASRQSVLLPSRPLHARWQGPVGLCVSKLQTVSSACSV